MDEVKDGKDVKALLDGQGKPLPAAGAIETRPASCEVHGDFADQKILVRAYTGLKPFSMPLWLGCPECRRLADVANKLEAKRWGHLIPGEPSWSPYRR
jgi:hypothetical protein